MLNDLRKIKQQELSKRQEPVKEVQKLLEYENQEDLRILRGLSKESVLISLENEKGKLLELEQFESVYGETFHISQIKKIAIDYNLRFLPSRKYTGAFDVEVASKLKEFSKKAGVELSEGTLEYKFYILAPEELFKLKKKKYISRAEIRRRTDPILFYKINETNYRLIHKWGNDFTVFRYLFSWAKRSAKHHFFMNFFEFLIFTTAFTSIFFPNLYMDNPLLIYALAFIPTLILSHLCRFTDEGHELNSKYSNTAWNSDINLT